MIYNDGFEIDEKGMVLECPKCGNSELDVQDKHCGVCGFLLYNYCLNDNTNNYCNHINSGNSRFCVKCGSKTHFGSSGVLKYWQEAKEVIFDNMLLEFRVSNAATSYPYIADWSYILLALNKKEYQLLIICLEGSRAKLISETLIIYVKDPFIKNVLKTKDLFDTMVDKIREHLELEFSKVVMLSPYDDIRQIETLEAEMDILF